MSSTGHPMEAVPLTPLGPSRFQETDRPQNRDVCWKQRVWYLGQVWHILVQKYANQWTLSFVSQLHSSPGRSAVGMGATYSSAPYREIIKLNSSQFSLGTL